MATHILATWGVPAGGGKRLISILDYLETGVLLASVVDAGGGGGQESPTAALPRTGLEPEVRSPRRRPVREQRLSVPGGGARAGGSEDRKEEQKVRGLLHALIARYMPLVLPMGAGLSEGPS